MGVQSELPTPTQGHIMPPDSSVDEILSKKQKLQKWLDQNQYTSKGILMYERIFGKTYVSVGGEHTTRKFTEQLNLRENMKVLDIGCGIGGSAFYMARRFGVDVYGVDLSKNMIGIAEDYRSQPELIEPEVKHRVQFYVEDAISMDYPFQFYNVVYSRDTILHTKDKLDLFNKFFNTVKDYGKILEEAGFVDVKAVDTTDLMMDMLKTELEKFKDNKAAFVEEFSEEGYNYIKQGWEEKIERCGEGDQVWGCFSGVKP